MTDKLAAVHVVVKPNDYQQRVNTNINTLQKAKPETDIVIIN